MEPTTKPPEPTAEQLAAEKRIAKGQALARSLHDRIEELTAQARSPATARRLVRHDRVVNRLVNQIGEWYADVFEDLGLGDDLADLGDQGGVDAA